MFDASAHLRRLREKRRADYFDYPQDARKPRGEGLRYLLHLRETTTNPLLLRAIEEVMHDLDDEP